MQFWGIQNDLKTEPRSGFPLNPEQTLWCYFDVDPLISCPESLNGVI